MPVTQKDEVRAEHVSPMPILKRECDIYPADLLADGDTTDRWWALYTRSRREKELMRRLVSMEIPFYCPIIEHQRRSPQGRLRTSYLPLFSNYVFIRGDEQARYGALTTGCISRDLEVQDTQRFLRDLRQIHSLIANGTDLTPEARLEAGTRVRVRNGALAGQEGTIIERRGQKRLLVAVDFLQQGASVELPACDLESLDG